MHTLHTFKNVGVRSEGEFGKDAGIGKRMQCVTELDTAWPGTKRLLDL